MRASEILNIKNHRSFEYPKRSWKFYQEWNKVIFLHWQSKPEMIQKFLPNCVTLDTIDGHAWISLVAFDINHIGVRSLPKLPHISDFHEINIRTYIQCKGKSSVYFLSMEGSKRSSCSVLKAISKFPYEPARMKRNDFSYESKNADANNSFEIIYRVKTQPFNKDETDRFLTERYAVFQEHKENLIEYDVHHLEWPIQSISIKELRVEYPKFNQLIYTQPDRMHYSEGVKVLTWNKRKHTL
ncbi:MAG: DUF2071 domain-containing protein [Aquaticitalea sp.]